MLKFLENYWNNAKKDALEKIELPDFPEEEIRRYQIKFSGIVQGVGFRYETWRMAEKLGLSGFAENLPNETVRVEVQGTKSRVMYLLAYLKSIKRIQITGMEMKDIPIKKEEGFEAVY